MYTEIINFILQPILGAAAGYITNDYAINMLFKSYTPLNIGGVIPKTRDEFIQNINHIIENEILNKEKIQSILESEAFVNNFDNLIHDIFVNAIYKTVSDKPVKDIDGYNEFVVSMNKLIDDNENIIKNSLVNISADIDINDILSNKQIKQFSTLIYDKLLEVMNNTDICNKVSDTLKTSLSKTNISDLLDTDKINDVISSIASCTINKENIQTLLEDKNVCTELLNNINLYDLMYDLFCTIINKNKKTITDFSDKIFDYVTETDEFKTILNKISTRLISFGLDCQIKIYDLLDKSSFDNFKQYFITNQDVFTKPIIEFVDRHSVEIKVLLVETVEDTINEMDSAKKALIGMGKGTLLNKIENTDINEFISNYLNNSGKIDKLAEIIAHKVEDYTKKITLSDLTKQLIGKNLVSDNNFSNFITKYLQSGIGKFVRNMIDNPERVLQNNTVKSLINSKVNDFFINILTSDKLINNLNHRLCTKLKSYTSKDLAFLIGNINNQNSDFNDFVYNFMADNKDSNILYIETAIKKFSANKTLCDMADYIGIDNITGLIKEKIKHYTNTKVGYDTKLTTHKILDSINNIENIQKTTSKKVLSSVHDKLGEALHKFVKSLSETNLKKLNDDELCEMAKGFMGNNLKPITYFGGLLGFIAGIILSFIKTGTNILAPITALNALIFGLVGFATNAIAINMLFRPYKEIRFLKHVPFFRHFSLGYIAKNKTVLADSMAKVIDEYLLSNESVNDIYENNKDKAKDEVVKKLSENDYEAINNFLSKNKDYMVSTTAEKLNQYLCDNVDKFSDILINQIDAINIIDFSDTVKDRIINSCDNINSSVSDKLSEKLYHICKEEKHISDKNVNLIIKFVSDNYIKGLSKHVENLTVEKLKDMILSLEDKYNGFSNKDLNTILDKSKIETLINNLLINTKNLLNSTDLNKQINNKIINSINLVLKNDKPIEDILNSSIANKIETSVDSFFSDENFEGKLSKTFIGYSGNLTVIVQNKIKSGLNFLTKGLYSMVGGDEIIENAVYKFMSEKLPKFLDSRKEEIYESANTVLKDRIFKSNVSDFGLSVTNELDMRIYDNFDLGNIFDSNIVNSTLNIFTKKYSNLKSLLSPINIDTIQHIFDFYGDEINDTLSKSINNIKSNEQNIETILTDLVDNKGKNILYNLSLDEIFNCLNREDINTLSNKLCTIVVTKDTINGLSTNLVDCINDANIDTNIKQFINIADVQDDVKTLLDKMLRCKSTVSDNLYSSVNELYCYMEDDNFNIINSNLKFYMINNITEACLLSLSKNLPKILKDINFDIIVKDQINNMSPKMIHHMFNSFAGKYFRRLMIYGLFGVVFGINIYVGLILSVAYVTKNLIERKRN